MLPLDPIALPLEGRVLIEASAGTGKTYTITTLVIRLLLERRLRVGEILVVTFTTAATAELRDRIRERIRSALETLTSATPTGDPLFDRYLEGRRASPYVKADREQLVAALNDFDEASVYTLHGFAQRMLREHAFESRVDLELELLTDSNELSLELAHDFWTNELQDVPLPLARYLAAGQKTPDALLGELSQLLETEAYLLPVEPVDSEELPIAWEARQRARTRWLSGWGESRDEVLALIEASERALKAHTYDIDRVVDDWLPAIELYARSEAQSLPEAIRRLSQESLAGATKKAFSPPEHRFFHLCSELVEAEDLLQSALARRWVAAEVAFVRYARAVLPERRSAVGVASFQDLLARLDRALGAAGGRELAAELVRAYPAALIDEFQDTDPVQYRIFDSIYADKGMLFQIGDPKQAIYGFRSADIYAYLKAARDSAESAYTLGTNWRSDPTLLEAISSLFVHAWRPFYLDEIAATEVQARPGATDQLVGAEGEPPLEILFVRRDEPIAVSKRSPNSILKAWWERGVPELVASEISRLLGRGLKLGDEALMPGHIAVLCETNAQAAAIQNALRALEIPCIFAGRSSVYDTAEAAELAQILAAIVNPSDGRALRSALATPLLGHDAEELARLRLDETAWENEASLFRRWLRLWEEEGFSPMFGALLGDMKIVERLLSAADGERRLTDVLHLGELLHEAASSRHRGPHALLAFFERLLSDEHARRKEQGDDTRSRLESDALAVQALTIHRSKGLEYPIVYCPYLWRPRGPSAGEKRRPRFHDPNRDDRLTADLGSDDHGESLALAEEEIFAEGLRLLYVALTRAKHRLSIVWGSFTGSSDSQLAYLLHQPQTLDGSADAPASSPAELREAISARLRSPDDEPWLEDLRSIVDRCPKGIELVEIGAGQARLSDAIPGSWRADVPDPTALRARTARRRVRAAARVSSFSGLTRDATHLDPLEEEGIDRDGLTAAARANVEAELELAAHLATAASVESPSTSSTIRLDAFPRGAGPGTLIHEVLEHLDFQRRDELELRSSIDRAIARYRLDADHAEPLEQALDEMLHSKLDERGLTLSRIESSARLNELEFVFPVQELRPRDLAAAFQRDRAPYPKEYANRLERLSFQTLRGYLRGFVDLVFRHEGRYYVVDYKSNHLGSSYADYTEEKLVEAMVEHHYFLQYHLYSVALHRFLTMRLPDYDYDRDFGGVLYLFLRGMSPETSPRTGVFSDRPTRELVEALDRSLAKGAST